MRTKSQKLTYCNFISGRGADNIQASLSVASINLKDFLLTFRLFTTVVYIWFYEIVVLGPITFKQFNIKWEAAKYHRSTLGAGFTEYTVFTLCLDWIFQRAMVCANRFIIEVRKSGFRQLTAPVPLSEWNQSS
jgi:hypothetical protein